MFGEPNSLFEIVFKILVLGVLPSFILVRMVYLDFKESRSQKESSELDDSLGSLREIRESLGVLTKTLLIYLRNLQEK